MNERKLILTVTRVSGIIVAVVLAAAALIGVDLGTMFIGLPWNSPLPHDRTAMVLEGIVVSITLVFGALFFAGILALLTSPPQDKQPDQPKPSE